MDREFKGIWIPAEIWLHPELTLVEKAMFAEIDSFTGNGSSFFKSNDQIQAEYGISRPTVSRSINKLEQLGLIVRRFDGRVRHLSSNAACSEFTGRVKPVIRQSDQNDQADGSNDTSKKKRKNKPKNKVDIVLPFDTPEFIQAWDLWVNYKREEHSFHFKSASSQQGALKKLSNLCNNDEQEAIAIIHDAIANGWKGLWARQKPKRTGAQDGSVIGAYIRGLGAQR